jgi:hypothetical protein
MSFGVSRYAAAAAAASKKNASGNRQYSCEYDSQCITLGVLLAHWYPHSKAHFYLQNEKQEVAHHQFPC